MSKVLIVEDNPLSLRFFTDALASFGVDAVGAVDAREALAVSAGTAFDLLLIDANLPDQPGAAVLAAIRAGDGPSRRAPAIATTAADRDAAAALRGAGFDAVIGKPVGIEALRAALADYIELRARADLLDDARALATAGGDAAIVAALRGLFATELDALPGELTELAVRPDRDGLRERLHRLTASAGFCGAMALATAVGNLQRTIDEATDFDAPLTDLLSIVRATRTALAGINVPLRPAPMR